MDIYGFLDWMATQFDYNVWTWEMMEGIIQYVIDTTINDGLSVSCLVSTLADIIPEVTEEEIRAFV